MEGRAKIHTKSAEISPYISDDEMKDFAFISKKLDEVSLAIDSLNLWIDKTASENNINISLLNDEKSKIK